MAHKYEVPHILSSIFKLLTSFTLVAWDGPWGQVQACLPSAEMETFPVAVSTSDADVSAILGLVRCIGASNTLTMAAFWQRCICGPDLLHDDITRKGGVVCRLSEEFCTRCVALFNVVRSRRAGKMTAKFHRRPCFHVRSESSSYRTDELLH